MRLFADEHIVLRIKGDAKGLHDLALGRRLVFHCTATSGDNLDNGLRGRLLDEFAKNAANLLRGAESEHGLELEAHARLERPRLQGGEVRAVSHAAIADAVGGGHGRVWKEDADALILRIHPRGPAFAAVENISLSAWRTRLQAGERCISPGGFLVIAIHERVPLWIHKHGGQFLMLATLVRRLARVSHAIAETCQPAIHAVPLLHDHVGNFLTTGPLARTSLHIKAVLFHFGFEHGGRQAFPATALHGVVAPGLAIPVGAIFVAIKRLLNVAPMVKGIQHIVRGARGREPADAATRVHVHAQADVTIVQVDPMLSTECLRGEACAGQNRDEGAFKCVA